jgi:hypothetical protein
MSLSTSALAFEPFAGLVLHGWLQPRHAIAFGIQPFTHEREAFRVRQLDEVMIGDLQLGLCAGQRRVGIDQVGRLVRLTAHLARVAVLILGMTVRAFAFHVPIGEEHVLHGVEELLDGFFVRQARFSEIPEDQLRELGVLS